MEAEYGPFIHNEHVMRPPNGFFASRDIIEMTSAGLSNHETLSYSTCSTFYTAGGLGLVHQCQGNQTRIYQGLMTRYRTPNDQTVEVFHDLQQFAALFGFSIKEIPSDRPHGQSSTSDRGPVNVINTADIK